MKIEITETNVSEKMWTLQALIANCRLAAGSINDGSSAIGRLDGAALVGALELAEAVADHIARDLPEPPLTSG
jgi:hypothetical protein